MFNSNIGKVKPFNWNISGDKSIFAYPLTVNGYSPLMYEITQVDKSFSACLTVSFENGESRLVEKLCDGNTSGITLTDAQRECEKHWSKIIYGCLDLSSVEGIRGQS